MDAADMHMTTTDDSYPGVSIAMAVYNCEDTLVEAAKSLLTQTYSNFELILCDDGSTDKTPEILASLSKSDSRVKVLVNERNLGLNVSLNKCLEHSRGRYYARMDGDDICSQDRLEKLVSYLDQNPGVALVSSWMTTFDEQGEWGMVRTKANPTYADFLKGSPFCHAPCMMRTDVLKSLGGYGTEPFLRRCEDLDLWFRLYAAGHRGANIQEPLYSMRDDRNARKRRTFLSRLNEARVRLRGYRMLKMPLTKQLYALRPVLIGFLPGPIYDLLHRWKLRK